MTFIQNPVAARAYLIGIVYIIMGCGCFVFCLTIDPAIWQLYIPIAFSLLLALVFLVLRNRCLQRIKISESGICTLRRKRDVVTRQLSWADCKEVGTYIYRGFGRANKNLYFSPSKLDAHPVRYLPQNAILCNYREDIMDAVLHYWPESEIRNYT